MSCNKPAKTYAEQLAILKSRGLVVTDELPRPALPPTSQLLPPFRLPLSHHRPGQPRPILARHHLQSHSPRPLAHGLPPLRHVRATQSTPGCPGSHSARCRQKPGSNRSSARVSGLTLFLASSFGLARNDPSPEAGTPPGSMEIANCNLHWQFPMRLRTACYAGCAGAEHPTSNIEHRSSNLLPASACWRFDVRCWMLGVRPRV